tara:strand:+ start:7453 stop:8001 length:549 start_codon:yes stop_codon:yes gene_type:complete
MPIKFTFNDEKALAALGFVASIEDGLSPLFVSKVLFFAEKMHINNYGRPIIGDTFIAMPRGPVPSTIKNYIDHKWDRVEKPDNFDLYISIDNSSGLRCLRVGGTNYNEKLLSATDRTCLGEAVEFCRGKTAKQLSDLTHFEKSWFNAPVNRPMEYEDFIDDDNPHKPEVIEMMKENAAYGIF